jgi:hypothetical protein
MPGALADVQAALRREQDKRKKDQKRHWRGTLLSIFSLETALCVAALKGFDFTLGVDFLYRNRKWRRPRATEEERVEVREQLESFFLSKSVDWLACLTLGTATPLRSSQLRHAMQYVKDRNLQAWLRERNVDRGMVVRTKRLMEEHVRQGRQFGGQEEDDHVDMSRSRTRMRMARWRLLYRAQFRKLTAREEVPLEERRRKVQGAFFWVRPSPPFPRTVG